MKLADCTKADLIWVIRRMCQLNLSDRELHTALRDLEYYKEQEQTGKARQQLEIQRAATNRYIEILRAYEGKPISAMGAGGGHPVQAGVLVVLRRESTSRKKGLLTNRKIPDILKNHLNGHGRLRPPCIRFDRCPI